jgi:tyrosine-protein kinase Etk/Wzc
MQESDPMIRKKEHFDFLPAGGTTSHGVELLNQKRFSELLTEIKQRYDYVLLYSPTPLKNMESQLLLKHADAVIGAVVEERWEDIQLYRQWGSQKGQEAFSCVLLDV